MAHQEARADDAEWRASRSAAFKQSRRAGGRGRWAEERGAHGLGVVTCFPAEVMMAGSSYVPSPPSICDLSENFPRNSKFEKLKVDP